MPKRRGGKQRARRPNGGDEDEGLRAGDDVEIHSLQAQPEHNGKAGTLVAFDAESGRWEVKLACGGALRVKFDNLTKPSGAGAAKDEGAVEELRGGGGCPPLGSMHMAALERAAAALALEDAAGDVPLAAGARIRVDGLVKASRYNGCTAVVLGVLENGRVSVLLDMPHGKEISIKAQNAVAIPRAGAANTPDGARAGDERAGAAGLHNHFRLQEIYRQSGYCHNRMLGRLNELYYGQDWRKMVQLESEALAFAEQVRALQPGIAGDLYGRFGFCHGRMGGYGRAIELHQQHRAVAEAAGDIDGIATAINNEGNCWKSLAKFEKAIEMFELAHALHGRLGDRISAAQNLDNIGLCLQKMGQHAKAVRLHEQSWRMSSEDASEPGQMRAALWLGSALWIQVLVNLDSRPVESRRLLQDAKKWFGKAQELGEVHATNFERDALLYLACVAFLTGEEEEAICLLGKHLQMWMALGRHHCAGCMQVRGDDAPMLTCNGCRVARCDDQPM